MFDVVYFRVVTNNRNNAYRVSLVIGGLLLSLAATRAHGVTAGLLPDTTANHIDPNTLASPFGGVGAVMRQSGAGFTLNGTGTLIDRYHVITAAHLVDLNNNGVPDLVPADLRFQLNLGGDATHSLRVASYDIAPGFTGVGSGANFNPHDDIAVFTLLDPAPLDAPVYNLFGDPIALGTPFTMVGYGTTWANEKGKGIAAGTILNASATVKRRGANSLDSLVLDDDGAPGKQEVFVYDYDHADLGNGTLGGASLGAAIETVHLPGDSGGPIFFQTANGYEIAGIMNYIGTGLPQHGSQAGGNIVTSYLPFITSVVAVPEPSSLAIVAAATFGLVRRRLATGSATN